MKKIKEKDMKKYGIIAMLVVIVILLGVGVVYAVKNYNKDDIVTVNTSDIKYTLSSNQLDSVKQPEVKVDVKYYVLPEAKNTLEYIDFNTLVKLFQNQKRSIVVLSDSTCSSCAEYLPLLTSALEKYNAHAYVIDFTKLAGYEVIDLKKYIAFEGTPTTYIISNSKVDHVLTGSADIETISAFVDYFYVRNN